MKNYKVYLIRDKQGVIKYAGLTSQSLQKRFRQHILRRHLSEDDYKIELVQEFLKPEEGIILEEMLIKQHSLAKLGWNNFRHETSRNGQMARLGLCNSEEHNVKISAGVSRQVICIESGEVFVSARKAAEKLNLQYSKISLVCNGRRHTTGGLHFRFFEKR